MGFFVLISAATNWVLEHLWVLPVNMRRSVGRKLLVRAQQVAKAGGALGIAIDSDPGAEGFYLAFGALRVGEVAAPIAGAEDRVRPQLLISVSGHPGC